MKKERIQGMIALLVLTALTAVAKESSVYDEIWGTAAYENDEAAVLQKLAFVGRLQGDAYSFGGDSKHNEDLIWRRLRLGLKTQLFQDWLIHIEGDFDLNEIENWDAFNNRLTDSYIGWAPSAKVKMKVGKQSAGFTLDGATSSKKLIAPERSIVAGNLWFGTEYFTGSAVYGEVGNGSYKAGAYSSSGESGFGHFESGYFTLLSGGIKVGANSTLRLDYVFNDTDYDSRRGYGTSKLNHIAALVYKTQLNEKLGLWADIAGGIGNSDEGMSDLLGVDIMPFYNFTENLQLVLQYAGVTSLEGDVDVNMARYASRNVNRDKVETAHNLLLGFNWYLYGHKLKWQNAVEYNYGKNRAGSGDDYNGYGLTSALRISW
ncbi:porin [Pontiella agarivorans]|uniref:Porin n=1 Tax=Pontiella agarivorans TaxID=3038953 RepID=A0ABU5N129_9BACT|nr:porin [Pontiella agarivorans]MDZ8120159.1 porin [Pontiella agarivorans]